MRKKRTTEIGSLRILRLFADNLPYSWAARSRARIETPPSEGATSALSVMELIPKDYPTIPKCFISTGWALRGIHDGLEWIRRQCR